MSSSENISEVFIEKYFYYKIFKPDFIFHLELPTLDLGVYSDGIFVTFIEIEKGDENTPKKYLEAPNINLIRFLDALFIASKKMEPFLTISTRLYKLIVDDYQDKSTELELDLEMYNKIKTMYWGILQEKATDELMEKGFELVMSEAMKTYVEKMLQDLMLE